MSVMDITSWTLHKSYIIMKTIPQDKYMQMNFTHYIHDVKLNVLSLFRCKILSRILCLPVK